jgi:hypothetical protein
VAFFLKIAGLSVTGLDLKIIGVVWVIFVSEIVIIVTRNINSFDKTEFRKKESSKERRAKTAGEV